MPKNPNYKNEYNKVYNRDKTISFILRLNKNHDSDLIEFLQKQKNKAKVMKESLYMYIEHMKGEQEFYD